MSDITLIAPNINIKMKAAYYTQYGSPDNFSIKEVDTPFPGENDLLVEVHATTVNRTDCAILKGSLLMRLFTGLFKPKKSIPGTDFAGKVISTGKNVTQFKKGDRVFGFDDMGLLSHAQFMAVNSNKAISHIPEGLSYEEAVASLETVHYAVNFINKIKTHPGQKVLINGATGGIGSVLVQLSKFYELNVTATCQTQHIDLVKSLGASKVIVYTKEDFLNTEEKFDFVFDAVGKSTFGKCKSILKDGGIYISSELGPNAENPFLALITKFTGSKKVIFPIPFDPKSSIKFILDLIAIGKFKPVIDQSYTHDEIQEAFRYVASGQKVGNVILSIYESTN
ncbi:alcohol dehydrogenase zinc-binding domain protein [Sporocytophaga myxococcoides]|uniref:Alcohol dehydrogenase zinc-binding domain protein n=1 Tax=Sporocytophaga myxococcoides TaxID=153721 RepID=A0A098LEB4_9BACT|nr:NAD(P)-dependent alcohol dehydrogenase [Sporocytophaga myxococcoides]GAL84754.1 alcohol dehydrogenase zinc-binding domain protein [Sporocytophaga myxococcoides]